MLGLAVTSPPPESPTQLLAPVILVAGVVMLGVIFTMSIRGKLARRRAAEPDARERINRAKSALRKQGDLAGRQAELHDIARQYAAQLDNKAERLDQLIAEARALVMRLESVLPAAGEVVTSNAEPTDASDPLTHSIYRLADAGRDPMTIAQQLDEQVGKVKLILALREG